MSLHATSGVIVMAARYVQSILAEHAVAVFERPIHPRSMMPASVPDPSVGGRPGAERAGVRECFGGDAGRYAPGVALRAALCCALMALLAACATCKSTDSPDVCRTKQREHSQPRI